MQAQEAFHYQTALGKIDSGTTFDSWRRDQVMLSVGRPGISKIGRSQWRTVYAHFLTLTGRDGDAYAALTTTGPKRDHGPASDNYESSEALVHKMREAIADHSRQPLTPGTDHIHPGWLLAAARQRTGKPTLTWDTMAERVDPVTLVGLLSQGRVQGAGASRAGRCLPVLSFLDSGGTRSRRGQECPRSLRRGACRRVNLPPACDAPEKM